MRPSCSRVVLLAVAALTFGAAMPLVAQTPPKAAPCDTSAALLKAAPIYGVGVKTITAACPAFVPVIDSLSKAHASWSASQLADALVGRTSTPPVVTPVPTPTPTPPSSEPVFDASTETMILQDDMERYADIVSMGATSVWNTVPRIVPNPSPVMTSQSVSTRSNQLISPGHGGTGKAIRMLYDGSYQGSSKFQTINLPSTPDLATHYMQYYGRVKFAEPFNGSLAVKWFLGWHKYSSTRVEWNTRYSSPAYRSIDPNPTIWQVVDQADAQTNGDQPIGPYPLSVFDGQWHRFTYSFRPNTSKGSRDGFARMWVDGTKIVDVSAAVCGIIPPGGTHAWCTLTDVDNLAAGDGVRAIDWGWTQTTATPAWTYDVDDVKWWVTR